MYNEEYDVVNLSMNALKFRAFNQEKELLDNMLETKSMKYNIIVSKLKLEKNPGMSDFV